MRSQKSSRNVRKTYDGDNDDNGPHGFLRHNANTVNPTVMMTDVMMMVALLMLLIIMEMSMLIRPQAFSLSMHGS